MFNPKLHPKNKSKSIALYFYLYILNHFIYSIHTIFTNI